MAKVKSTTWKANWRRVKGKPHQLQVELRNVKALTPASTLVLELQQALQRVGQLEQQLAASERVRAAISAPVAEMNLEQEALRRCDEVATNAQLQHRARLFRGMVDATKKLILAERRIKELEAEIDCLKSVRVAS